MSTQKAAKIFVSSILAGIAISIGCTAFLFTEKAIYFPIGLFIVCFFGLYLFTGKVPYAKDKQDLPMLGITFVGNMIGAILTGIVIRCAKPALIEKAAGLCKTKLGEGYALIPLAILCNVLIFVAVDVYKNTNADPIFRFAGLWMATTVFVICGFEHCVANAFYFALAGMTGSGPVAYILLNMVFNAVGGLLAFYAFSYAVKAKK